MITGTRDMTTITRILACVAGTAGLILLLPWGGTDLGLAPASPNTGVPGDPVRGELLYRKLDCVRCHSIPRAARGGNIPADLALAGSRSGPEWLAEYLRSPTGLRFLAENRRPGMRMPDYGLEERETRDLAAFLSQQRDTVRVPNRRNPDWLDRDMATKGRLLFDEYQCLGCHRLGTEGTAIGPALDRVGARRNPEYIAALLRDPQKVIPGTAMKNHDFWDTEVDALTAFLMTLNSRNASDP